MRPDPATDDDASLMARCRQGDRAARTTLPMHRSAAAQQAGAGWSADWEPASEADHPEQQRDDLQRLHAVRLAPDGMDARCGNLPGLLFTGNDQRLPCEAVARRLGLTVRSIGPTRARSQGQLRALRQTHPGG